MNYVVFIYISQIHPLSTKMKVRNFLFLFNIKQYKCMGTVLMCFIQTGSLPFIHFPFKLPSFSLRSVFSFILHSQSKICLIGYELKLGLLQRKQKLFGFIVQYRLFFKKTKTLLMRIYIAHAYKHWSNIQTQMHCISSKSNMPIAS